MRLSVFTVLFGMLSLPVAAEDGFSREQYEKFVDMRTGGDGNPVYWYSTGTVKAYPSGELVATMEGFDTARVIREGIKAHQLSRKTYIFRDPTTGELIREVNGEPVEPIKYPYQFITYGLEDGLMTTVVEQGRAPRLQTIGPSKGGLTVRNIGDVSVFTAPLYLDFPLPNGERYQAFENYDFFIQPSSVDRDERYQLSWVRYGAAPPLNNGEPVIMHLVTWRVDSFEELPESMREFVLEEAPLWQEPPADMAEIRALQAPLPDQEAKAAE